MKSTYEVSCNSEESTARTQFTRGKAMKACVAKAAGWTLEKTKDVTLPKIKEYKMTWCGLIWKSISCVHSNGIPELYIEILRRELLRVTSTFSTRVRTKVRVGNFGWQMGCDAHLSIRSVCNTMGPRDKGLKWTRRYGNWVGRWLGTPLWNNNVLGLLRSKHT